MYLHLSLSLSLSLYIYIYIHICMGSARRMRRPRSSGWEGREMPRLLEPKWRETEFSTFHVLSIIVPMYCVTMCVCVCVYGKHEGVHATFEMHGEVPCGPLCAVFCRALPGVYLVCTCMRICMCMSMYMCMHMYAHVCTCMHMYAYVCMCVCMRV